MFDNPVDKQDNSYNFLMSSVKNKMISHAYLIDENNNSMAMEMVLSFVKAVVCGDNYQGSLNCDKCSICKRIDDGNYSELKIIEPDGLFIKKEQILNLQQEFSREPIEGNKRIYIIRDCDKMRPETANSMLKFLEEPEVDVLAILMTNNYNNVLPTIISRCQIIKFNAKDEITTNEEDELIVLDFLESMENNGKELILNLQKIWFDKVISKDREYYQRLFDILIDMYYDLVKLKIGISKIKYSKYYDKLCEFVNKNTLNVLLEKLNYLLEAKDSIKFNVNINLLMDSVVINVGGRNECSRS